MKKVKGKNCVWFYHEGWRVGKIIKRYSENRVTVMNCEGRRFRCQLNKNGKWVALSNKDFKDQKHIRKEKEDVKKGKGKKRIKIKIAKRKIRKSIKNTKQK